MASELKVDKFTGVTTAGSIDVTSGSTTTNLQQGLAKMVINYDQIANSIRSSLNVSSVSDDATGQFEITFSASFNDINYSPSSASLAMAASSDRVGNFVGVKITSQSTPNARSVGLFTGSVKIDCGYASSDSSDANEEDNDANGVQIFGDLA